MTCHYLDDYNGFKICKAKGTSPPTHSQLMQFCYKAFKECPVYVAYCQKYKDEGMEMGAL